MTMMDEQKKARGHLDDLLALEEGLTKKEIWWIDTINDYWAEYGRLTEKYIKIIYNIYDRRC